jgi:hypothetical protein
LYTPVILALKGLKLEDLEFEAKPGIIVRTCLKKKKNRHNNLFPLGEVKALPLQETSSRVTTYCGLHLLFWHTYFTLKNVPVWKKFYDRCNHKPPLKETGLFDLGRWSYFQNLVE